MEFLGWINAEGGPLVLADVSLIREWTGIFGADYDRACALFDSETSMEGSEIDLASGTGFVWEMCGAGAAAVFRDTNEHLVIVRSWPKDAMDPDAPYVNASAPMILGKELGTLSAATGALAILWAVEEGSCVELPGSLLSRRPTGETSVDDAGLIVPVEHKIFRCVHDDVNTRMGKARRLHLHAILSQ